MKALYVDPASEVNINIPNLGLLYAATFDNVPVADQHILPFPKDRFLRLEADVLGLSIRSFTRQESDRIARAYRNRYPRARVKSVSGFVDVQCCYPFEKREEGIHHSVPFGDNLPFPRFELLDSFNYLQANWESGFWGYPLMSSQGCPYGCVFCASRRRKWMARSPEHCCEELRRARDHYGIRRFEIIDDAFNIDRGRVLDFCEKVAPLNLLWSCPNGIRADRFDEEQARAMRRAGCTHVGFGVESIDPAVLKGIRKGERYEEMERAVDIAVRHFPDVHGFFICGLPGSSFESDMAGLQWAKRKGIRPCFSFFVPSLNGSPPEGAIFTGGRARPRSPAYPPEKQRKVYRLARKEMRRSYFKRNLFFAVAWSTLRALPKYNRNSLHTHVRLLASRFFSVLCRGEIQ